MANAGSAYSNLADEDGFIIVWMTYAQGSITAPPAGGFLMTNRASANLNTNVVMNNTGTA